MHRKVLVAIAVLFFFWPPALCLASNYGDNLGQYKGVIAYANGEPAGNIKGDYQCVEYVKRFYDQTYHVTLGPIGKASKAFSTWKTRNDFLSYAQGSSMPPVPDDILCYSAGASGHVAIVTEVTDKKVKVIEQNFSTRTCWGEMTITRTGKGYTLSARGKYQVQGWLHYAGNQTATEPLPLDFLSGSVTTALVIDSSNSMAGEKMAKAVAAANSYIDASRDWDQIALVGFAEKAWLLQSCLNLGSGQSRTRLKDRTNTISPQPWTNIGAGLSIAFDQLSHAPKKSRPIVLLLSDGVSNRGDLWGAVAKFEKAGWPIYPVAYGLDADRNALATIAQRTGGTCFWAETSNIAQVYQKISARSRLGSVLVSYNDSIEQGKTLSYLVAIAKDLTSAVFSCDWQGSRVGLKLIPPSKDEITPQNWQEKAGVRYAESASYSLFVVDHPEPGDWRTEIYGTEVPVKEQVNLTVSGTSPLMFNSLATSPYFRPGERMVIIAQAAEIVGGRLQRLAKVQVIVWIHKPEPNVIGRDQGGRIGINLGGLLEQAVAGETKIYLQDDGKTPDARADDGIFTAVYEDTKQQGPYLIDLRCIADLSDGQHIDRLIHESFHVGDIRTNMLTLSRLLGR